MTPIKPPPPGCHPYSGTTTDGKKFGGYKCSPDPERARKEKPK